MNRQYENREIFKYDTRVENDSIYRSDALTQEVLYSAKSNMIRAHFAANPIGNKGFWENVHSEEIAHHLPIVQDVINFYSGVIASKLRKVSVKNPGYDNILQGIFHEDNQQDFRQIIEEIVRKTLIYGDVCIKYEFDSGVMDVPIITIVNGLDVEYVVRKDRIVEAIFKTKYTYENMDYLLIEVRKRGSIKYELFIDDDSGESVPLNTIPELSELTPEINYDGDMMAIPFRFWKHPTNEHRGLPLFANKVDVINRLDEIGSALNIAIRKSEPHIMYSEKALRKQIVETKTETNGAGYTQAKPVSIQKPLKGQDFIVFDSDQTDPHRMPKWMEAIQTEIQSDELAAAKKMAIDDVCMGIISPESLGINLHKPSDNATAQRDREKITIHKINEMIGYLTPLLKNLIIKTFQFVNIISSKELITDHELEIIFLSYGDETFKERILNIVQARPGENVISKLSALAYLFPEKSEDWIVSELDRLENEAVGPLPKNLPGLDDVLNKKETRENNAPDFMGTNIMDGDGEERNSKVFDFYKKDND